jgi:hypothetical protein
VTLNEQVLLLVIGAGIALVSSLATAIVTNLISYRLQRRAHFDERKSEFQKVMGRLVGLAGDTTPRALTEAEQEELLEMLSRISPSDITRLNFMLGRESLIADRWKSAQED